MSSPTPFQAYILSWYARYGRHELPWRQTEDPYKILVSEVMLQQTQVERVIPKYSAFLSQFPTPQALSSATLATVLQQWQGLGYNRRAKFLQKTAQAVVHEHDGQFPTDRAALQALPGIGPYTSAAICTFAFNQPHTLIETNVRRIFLYHFFPDQTGVPDSELFPLIEQELWQANPREWYAALMDYGAVLKKQIPNPNTRSKHYTKQSTFKGSVREVRGAIIRLLTQHTSLTLEELRAHLTTDPTLTAPALAQLLAEGMIQHTQARYALSTS